MQVLKGSPPKLIWTAPEAYTESDMTVLPKFGLAMVLIQEMKIVYHALCYAVEGDYPTYTPVLKWFPKSGQADVNKKRRNSAALLYVHVAQKNDRMLSCCKTAANSRLGPRLDVCCQMGQPRIVELFLIPKRG